MTLVIHSSLSSIGHVDGGARTVVNALMSVLGKSGTLMVPTFTYSFEELSFATEEPFDPEKTKSRVGAITEAVRHFPGAVRSFHPTHSVAAVGKLADKLTRDHLATSPFGFDNPFHRLSEAGGYVLLLGVGHTANSLVHVAEVFAGVPYLNVTFTPGREFERAIIVRNGKKVLGLEIYESPGCSRGFGAAEEVLESAGLIKWGKIGDADTQLFNAKDALDCLIDHLKKYPGAFLCINKECDLCTRRKQTIN